MRSGAPRKSSFQHTKERNYGMEVSIISFARLEELRRHTAQEAVPQKLTSSNIMHKGLPGAKPTKHRGRGIALWPTMSKDMDNAQRSHALCVTAQNHQQKPL